MTDSYFANDMVMEESLASWLDGMMSPEESYDFMTEMASNPDIVDLLDINDDVVEEYEALIDSGYELPDEFYEEFDLPVASEGDVYLFQDTDFYSGDDEHFHTSYTGSDITDDVPADFREPDAPDSFPEEVVDEEDSLFDGLSVL